MRTGHFRRRFRALLAGLSLLAGLFAIGTSPAAAAPASTARTVAHPAPPRIMTIIMENTDYSQFAGSSAMPYLNSLAHSYATFTRAFGWTYPSLPNYLALLSGSDQGTAGRDCDITDKGCGNFTSPTLAGQLDAKGLSWNAYYQGLPSGCFQADGGGNYPYWHNPFRYFKDFKKQCGHISNFSDLLPNLNKANPADFQWVVPDLVNSGGDNGTMSSGDSWLAGELPRIMASRWYRGGGQIVIIYDTGYEDSGGVNGSSGGQIPLVVVSAHDKKMGAVKTPVNTAGVLRSIEKAYGLPFLAGARDARNGTLGSALVSGRPVGAGLSAPTSSGATLSFFPTGVPRALEIIHRTISINGIARIVADPIPNKPLPVISVGQDSAGHGVVVYPGQGIQVVRGASDLESVACVFAQCFAVGLAAPNTDEAVLVNIVAGTVTTVTRLPAFIGLYGIACPSQTCYAVGYDNANDADAVTTIVAGNASPPAEVKGGSEWLNAISCAPSSTSSATCYAAGLVNFLPAIVPITNGKPGTAVVVPNAWYLNGIFCTSVGNCLAVGENTHEQGIVAALAGGKMGPVTVVKGTEFLYGVACLAAGSCAVTGAGTPVGGYSSGVVAPFTGTATPGKVSTMPQTNGFGQAIPYYGRYLTVGATYLRFAPPAR
jgi:phosphatidylinositol-3-phosphatase